MLLARARSRLTVFFSSFLSLCWRWRQHLRLPHVVVKFGSQLLKNAASKLGNAVWDLYERVFVAALDAHDYPVAAWCLSTLDAQWPGSTRVARLKGMNSEARGHFAAADDLYTEFLEDDQANMSLQRRRVACAKGAGDLAGAIKLLNAYVKNFASDENAWVELSELYLQSQQYDLASFALEELIMLCPENYLYHLKYAEIQYTLNNMDVARQYYAQSLELKPNNNLRAVYGLILTLKSRNGTLTATNPQELYRWTVQQLLAHYNKYQSKLIDLAKVVLTEDNAKPTSTQTSTATTTTTTTSFVTTATAAAQTERETPQETELPD